MIPSRSSGETIASCKLALCNGVIRPACGFVWNVAALEVGHFAGTNIADTAAV